MTYRALDPHHLRRTTTKIIDQIDETFPGSGLSGVGAAFRGLTDESLEKVNDLNTPIWRIRILSGILILITLLVVVVLPLTLTFQDSFTSWADFLEGTDAGFHLLAIIGGGIYFIASWERRVKRNLALDALSELRAMAHIIDMHQISKDPGLEHITPLPEGQVDTRTVRSDAELALYLDFSSDMLSIVGKLASLYAKKLHDRDVLDAVNEIESLTNGLCGKLWQKIMIINHMAESHAIAKQIADASCDGETPQMNMGVR